MIRVRIVLIAVNIWATLTLCLTGRHIQWHHHTERVLQPRELGLCFESQDLQAYDANLRLGGAGSIQWST